MKNKEWLYKEWLRYNEACKKLIIEFLNKYYPDESGHTVYFIGDGIFNAGDSFYNPQFCAECLQHNATFEDISSYQDYEIDCTLNYKEKRINFENWVKRPELRRSHKEEKDSQELIMAKLLKRCIGKIEGITGCDDLVKEIRDQIKHYV